MDINNSKNSPLLVNINDYGKDLGKLELFIFNLENEVSLRPGTSVKKNSLA